jgi:type I restriction enzyme S subunit
MNGNGARRWKRYAEHRDSGVEWLGNVPGHWAVKRLKFACRINPSKSEISGLPSETEVSFLPMECIGTDGTTDLSRTKRLCEVRQGFTYFRDGDVIVAKITPCFENGKGALCSDLANGVGFGTTELHVLRPLREINPRFIFYATIADQFRVLGTTTMYGAAGQQRVSEQFVLDFPLGISPADEQHHIADFLDRETAKLKALIAKKERLIELLQEKRAALISHAVTKGLDPRVPMKNSGVEWLGKIPAHWSAAPVYAKYEVQLGKMLDAKRITGEHLAPYLRNVDVQWDDINVEGLPEMDFTGANRARFSLRAGDLLVCEGGEVGRAAIWSGQIAECYYQKAIHRLRPFTRNELARFLYYVLFVAARTGVFVAEGNQNTIDHLTAEKLRKHRFPFPPFNEQESVVAYLDRETAKIDALVAKVQEVIDRLREYRTALISAAVTGKIDVREEAV